MMKRDAVIIDRFELQKKLGWTAFGEVWLAEDRKTSSRVALKIISPELFSTQGEFKKLKKEFNLFLQVKCRNISELKELFNTKGLLFYTAEYVEGIELTELRGESLSKVLPYFIDITKALIELHNYGIVHGTVKPTDIIIKSDGQAKLVDTGLMSTFENKFRVIKSNYSYTAPEIINQKTYDWRADLYSLGMIMYETLYTKLPWDTPFYIDDSETVSDRMIQFPENSHPEINSAISRLLSLDPDNRFNDTGELLTALEHIYTGTVKKSADNSIQKSRIHILEPDFMSRRSEMSKLLESLDNFEATTIDHAVIIESPKGAGRTRFLKEFINKISSRNLKTIFFSANQTQNLISDLAVKIWELLDRELRLQLSFKWGPAILLYFPQFEKYGEFKKIIPAKDLPHTHEDFYRLSSLLRDFINMSSRNNPLVLVLDNFNHIDKRSLRLIQELSSSLDSGNRLFCIVTVEPGNDSNIEIPAFSRITLAPFTFSETRAFIESCLNFPASKIDNELFVWVYRNSKGLAKNVRSLLFLLIEEKVIVAREGHVFFKKRKVADDGIEKLLRSKIASFSDKEKSVLKACSIYKRFVTKEALYYLLMNELKPKDIDMAIDVLETNYLLVKHKNGKINIVNQFFQPIIYSLIPKNKREKLHKEMGDYIISTWKVLMGMNINHFAFAAHHYQKAGKMELALKLYLQSVGGFMAHLNSELAESSIDEALTILDSNPKLMEGKKLYAVYLFSGRMYFKLGIFRKATSLLEKSYSIWKDDSILEDLVFSLAGDSDPSKALKLIAGYNADTPERKAVKHYLRAFVYLNADNNFSKAEHHLKRAIGLIKKNHASLFGPIRRFTIKQMQFDIDLQIINSDYSELNLLRKELLQSAGEMDSKAFFIDALNISFDFYWNFNQMKKAYEVLHQTLKLSLEIFDNFRISRSYLNLAKCSHRIGRLNDVRFYLDKAIEYARKGCGVSIVKQCYFNYAELAIINGEFSLAENFLYNAREISEREHRDPELINIYSLQTLLSILRNDLGIARNTGGKLRRYIEEFKSINHQKSILSHSTLMLLEAITGNDREYFFELDRKMQKLFQSYPLFKQTSYLLYITCRIIYSQKTGRNDDAMDMIYEVEQNSVISSHTLFQMLYYYHASLFLKDFSPSSGLLRKYLNLGLKLAMKIQSNHFYSLFDRISFLLEREDTESILTNIRDILKKSETSLETRNAVDTELTKLHTYFTNTKNQIEILNTMNSNYTAIIDIVKSIAGKTDFQRITDSVIKKVIEVLSLELCGIVFTGNSSDDGTYCILDSSYREYKMSEFRFKAGIVPRMLKTGRMESISGTPDETGSNFRFVAAVPIVLKGELKAYIYLERDSSIGTFSESQINFLETLSENLAVILDNVELVQIATTDTLTKLYTRRHFFSILEKEIEKADRYNFTVSMIMLDIDHFKEINDTYGHLAGDNILKHLGILLKNSVRSSDYVGRFGGEEFVILLPGTDLEGAYQTAEKIRKSCGNHEVSGISFSVSLGVASFHEDRIKNEKDFIEKCDMAMYRAKSTGRNNAVKFSELVGK